MILTLLSKIYGIIINARNKRFDEGKKEIVHCSVPVISVGNISAGGTSKTPFVIEIEKILLDSGHKPAIIGRGYKRKRKGYKVVSDGKNILADIDDAGDEMLMLAEKLKVPVVAHESKSDTALKAEKEFDIDSIIIDDGFQHRRLHRDLDIVLIDNETLENSLLLPKGKLREPLDSILRADVIIKMGSLSNFALIEGMLNNKKAICDAEIRMSQPYELSTGTVPNQDKIPGIKKACIAVSGIAKPERFRATLIENGYNIVEHLTFPDHNYYSKTDVVRITKECERKNVNFVITTEKDAVKLRNFRRNFDMQKISVFVLPVEIRVSEGKEELVKIINNLFV